MRNNLFGAMVDLAIAGGHRHPSEILACPDARERLAVWERERADELAMQGRRPG